MNFVLIFVITAILQFFTPWWTIALVPFLVNLWIPETSLKAFALSFAAVALLWFFYGLYLHVSTEGIMSDKISEIFSLPNGILLLLVTALVGGLVGGFAGWSGLVIRKSFGRRTFGNKSAQFHSSR